MAVVGKPANVGWPELLVPGIAQTLRLIQHLDFGIWSGVRLFDPTQVDLRCVETVQGEGAIHLRYEVL